MEKEEIDEKCRELAEMIKQNLSEEQGGFCLILYDWGESGNMGYISSGEWEGTTQLMRELAVAIESERLADTRSPAEWDEIMEKASQLASSIAEGYLKQAPDPLVLMLSAILLGSGAVDSFASAKLRARYGMISRELVNYVSWVDKEMKDGGQIRDPVQDRGGGEDS